MTKVGPAFRDTLQIARLGHGHQQRDNLMRYAASMIKVTSSKMEETEERERGRERKKSTGRIILEENFSFIGDRLKNNLQ